MGSCLHSSCPKPPKCPSSTHNGAHTERYVPAASVSLLPFFSSRLSLPRSSPPKHTCPDQTWVPWTSVIRKPVAARRDPGDHPHRFPGWWESCFPRRRTRKLDFKVLKRAGCLPGRPMFKTKGPPLAGSLLLPKSSNEVDVSKFEECVVFLYCGGVARIPRYLFFPVQSQTFFASIFFCFFLVDFIDVLG